MGKVIDLDDIPDEAFWCRDALVEALMDAPTIEPGPKLKFCSECKHFHKGEPYSMCYRTPYPYIVDGENDYCSFVDEGR